MAKDRKASRLCDPDPWDAVKEARKQRRIILGAWIMAAIRRRRGFSVRKGSRSRLIIVAMLPLAAGYFLSYMFRNINGIIAPDIMRDLRVGPNALGLLTSVYFLTFATAQLPVGVLLDRYGPSRVQCALLLCAATGAGLCALSGGFASVLLGRALIGFGTAGGLVAGLKASAYWFPREQLGTINGAFIMCGGLGALAATWPADFVLGAVDWRGLSLLMGIAACIVAFAIWCAVPSQKPTRVPGQEEVRLQDVVRDPLFRRFAPLSAACFGSVLAVQGLWAGPWLSDVAGLSRPEVASDLACMAIVLIVAAPCWGALTRRLRERIALTRVAVWAALILMMVEALILASTGLPSVLPWCLFATFGGMTVLSYSVIAEHFPAAAVGRANGALNVLHIGCSFLVQLGIGQVIALWPPAAGKYPLHAYQAGLLLPLALQTLALLWFAWPRGSLQLACSVPRRVLMLSDPHNPVGAGNNRCSKRLRVHW